LAYELGWRIQPRQKLSVSIASFFNVYDNIRSAEPGPPPFTPFPLTIANGVKGKTYGIEFSAMTQLTSWWNLRGGYTFLKKDMSVKSNSRDLNGGTAESDDPENQFLIQSSMDLPYRVELGTVIRYISKLPNKNVSGYFGLDMRMGWKLNKFIELNIVGQNLLDNRHPEFIPSSPSPREIERSIYGKIICQL
ncbi:MAG TPA: TonB-dependent receptor, partial [Ferruginibacter sp.]|nr:TonB-dependent receptor [Ferruginibacter sp.]